MLTRAILNIGLDVKATRTLAAHVALEVVKANGLVVVGHTVVQSDTEPTLVVEGYFDTSFFRASGITSLGQAIHQTAVDLQQDCIAAWLPEHQKGRLIGPNAVAWGDFNPEFFLMPDGTRLASAVAHA